MINNVVLVGRLTRDVELRYTGSGTAVGNFTIAIDRPFKNASGEKETDFINCQAWRKTAENLANYTRKGSLVGVQGRIQTRNYTKDDGQKVYVTEVVADNFSLLESKNKNDTGNSGHQNTSNQTYDSNAQNNKNTSHSKQPDPFEKTGSPIDISDDDLPF